MKELLSRKTVAIPSSGIRRFFDLVSERDDVISLGVGEPDFDTPWHIREAGIRSLERGYTFYTSNAGLMELRREISNYINARTGISYDPSEEILVTVGGSEAIDLALRALINEGDEVIIPQPSYVSYEPCAVLAGAKPVIACLREEDGFKLTPEILIKAITPKTKALILPFPNNPTGSIMRKEELEPIAQLAIENDIIVISDEIYSELTYGGEHFSIISLPGMRERTILINGFSKSYAMTGWRLGYTAAPHFILAQMLKIHQFAIMCAPTGSQYAAISALKNGDSDVEKMREAYNTRRLYLLDSFKKAGLSCFAPEGAFYVFPSIKKFGLSSEDFSMQLLDDQKLAVVPGTAFGACGEGFLRISYAYSLDDLKEATKRIAAFIKKLKTN